MSVEIEQEAAVCREDLLRRSNVRMAICAHNWGVSREASVYPLGVYLASPLDSSFSVRSVRSCLKNS